MIKNYDGNDYEKYSNKIMNFMKWLLKNKKIIIKL